MTSYRLVANALSRQRLDPAGPCQLPPSTAAISEDERSWREAASIRFRDHLGRRGGPVAGEWLHGAAAATTVRCWDGGDVITTGGPLAESRERLTGVFIVDCMDLSEAIDVAASVPAAWYGAVKVRPVRED